MSYRSLGELKEIAERRNQGVEDFLYEMICDSEKERIDYESRLLTIVSLCREYQYHDDKYGKEENVNYEEIINVAKVDYGEDKQHVYDGKDKGIYI